ncbi:MAG: Npt1/Npt2 family nucleotide transporter [Candidatus Aminicenantes bacterium]
MAKNRLQKILSPVVEIKPGEASLAFLLFFYFFLITAPHTIIKSLRNASYLETLGAVNLPLAYLLTAVLMGFVVALHSKLQVRIKRQILFISSLLFFLLNALIFWLLFPLGWDWLPLVFWIWANIFILVLMTQFWMLVNDVFNPREAKRLIGFFGSGGILGGVAGGMVAGFLAPSETPHHLLLISCGLLALCVMVVYGIFILEKRGQPGTPKSQGEFREREKNLTKVGFGECFHTVRKNYYLKLMAGMVAITMIVSTLIDFQFNKVIKDTPSVSGNLTSFFGYFNAGLLILPFFLQLFMTSGFIKRYGIRMALMLFPIVLLACSLGIAVFITIYLAVLLKGSDKSLSYSLNQSVRELLYIPVSSQLKYKAKIFIDMFLNRFAKGLGAVILMILLFFPLGIPPVRLVSLASAVFIMGWILLNLKISNEYVGTVKQNLEMKWDRADKILAEKVDMDYTKLVFDTLESKNRSSVLYAMHLFDLIKQDKLTPEIKKLISYKSDEIRAASLGTLLEVEETTWYPEMEEYLEGEDLEKNVKEIMSLDVYEKVMKDYMGKVVTETGREAETAKMEVAKAMGLMDQSSPLLDNLEELLDDESPEVGRYAVESAARLKRKEYIPSIIKILENPVTREDASAALKKYGSKIVGTLSDYLGDPEENIEVRRAAASVLARIGSQDAADLLCRELAENSEDLEEELIEALDKIRAENTDILFFREVIEAKIIQKVKKYYQMIIQSHDSRYEDKKEEMREKTARNLAAAFSDIFKFLELVYPREDIIRAYQSVKDGTKDSVGYGVELLDNILKKELKDIILPVVEDLSEEERVKRFRSLLKTYPGFKPYG